MSKILVPAGILILMIIIMLPIMIIGTFLGGGVSKATGSYQGNISVSNSCVTPLLPRISDKSKFAAAIDSYIKKKTPSSPLVGLGNDFVEAGSQYGINPAWLINIARKESTFGTHIPPGTFNSYGRTATDSQPGVVLNGRRWYKYESFAKSAYGQSEYLKRVYIDKGLVTFETITAKYAPPGENDTQGYIAQMKQWVGEVVALAGDGLICEDSSKAK